MRGAAPWSGQGLRGPQPDGQNSEDCVAVLNNIYQVRTTLSSESYYCSCCQDGVKFHDEGCSHQKPAVCEQISTMT